MVVMIKSFLVYYVRLYIFVLLIYFDMKCIFVRVYYHLIDILKVKVNHY